MICYASVSDRAEGIQGGQSAFSWGQCPCGPTHVNIPVSPSFYLFCSHISMFLFSSLLFLSFFILCISLSSPLSHLSHVASLIPPLPSPFPHSLPLLLPPLPSQECPGMYSLELWTESQWSAPHHRACGKQPPNPCKISATGRIPTCKREIKDGI